MNKFTIAIAAALLAGCAGSDGGSEKPSGTDGSTDGGNTVDTGDTGNTTTQQDLITLGWLGFATIDEGAGTYEGEETLFVFEGEDFNAQNAGTATDLCFWTQDAADWSTSHLNDGVAEGDIPADPFAARDACTDCEFSFTIRLNNARETTVTGDCAPIIPDAPEDVEYSYGFDAEGYEYAGATYPALMFYYEDGYGAGEWAAANAIADYTDGEFGYYWVGGLYYY